MKSKGPIRKASKKKFVSLEVSLANLGKGPNLSRKNQGSTIYSFPSFDKCDSLLFFPSRFAAYLNSGDLQSFRRLIGSRIDSNCPVWMLGLKFNVIKFVRLFEIMSDYHPDSLMCVHTTKVNENRIQSELYFKYTDSLSIRASMEKLISDPIVHAIFSGPRHHSFNREQLKNSKPDHEKEKIDALLQSPDDLTVYGKTLFTLTFDDYSKKIIDFTLQCEMLSVAAI